MLSKQHAFALGIVLVGLSRVAGAQQAPTAPTVPSPATAPATPPPPAVTPAAPAQAPATSTAPTPAPAADPAVTAQTPPPAQPTSLMAAEPDVTYDTVSSRQYNYVEQAREYASWTLAYEVAFPVADLNTFIGSVSPRGLGFAGEFPVYKGLRIGGTINYNRFYGNQPRDTYYLDNGAVTATLYRYVDVWSLAALARYRFLEPNSGIRPFIGVGLGVSFLSATTLVADLGFQDTPAGFLFQPEAGVTARLSAGMQALLAVRYTMTTAAFREVDMPSYISLQIGLSWDTRI
jgi:Lipid A 3-O-deacylase (PagL)